MPPALSPAQQAACEELVGALSTGHVFVLEGGPGMGRTTVLREVQRRCGGAWRAVENFVDLLGARHPLAVEEAFADWLMQALAEHDLVVLDDLHLLLQVVGGYGCGSYPRSGLVDVVLKKLAAHAAAAGKRLVFGSQCGYTPQVIHHLTFRAPLVDFTPADYEHLCRAYLDGPAAGRLDYAKVHRFAPRLNAHQLQGACVWLRREEGLDTERFLDFLRSRELTSNVDLAEVQPVSLRDLRGVDEVVEALEAHVVLPLENDELASELGLRPKRGVLLVGPPGTGKTTVGRALAHRLQSKFFLIDGTVISGTDRFYAAVHGIFEQAKYNAPAVIFIDDSDVIFESGEELGLYRYLLTMLDGLESASAGRVCLVLTAMDVSSLPPALLRSGRVELWPEMRLPDAAARADILRQHLEPRPAALAELHLEGLVDATDGCTGADLKRLVEDGKNLLAYDKARGRPPRPVSDYFLGAVEALRANRLRYAEAEAHARRQRPARPVYYDVADGRA
jgi:tRNA A37 threonylcarbamoyladenosine biosynthesis protein TsaE